MERFRGVKFLIRDVQASARRGAQMYGCSEQN